MNIDDGHFKIHGERFTKLCAQKRKERGEKLKSLKELIKRF